jgi:hypothetical protein
MILLRIAFTLFAFLALFGVALHVLQRKTYGSSHLESAFTDWLKGMK